MSVGRRLDLHVHSRHSSDSSSPLDRIVAECRRNGLDGFALTDHNSVAGHDELAELAGQNPDLTLIPGVEVSTREGHLLVYGVTELPERGLPIVRTVAWARALGGIAVLAHPLRRTHGAGADVARSAPVDAIETVNGHNGERANSAASGIASGRGIGGTGGSDAHRPEEVGRAFTVVPSRVRSAAELVRSIREGSIRAGGSGLGFRGLVEVRGRSAVDRAKRGLRPI